MPLHEAWLNDIASSGDGERIYLLVRASGQLYTSGDAGERWQPAGTVQDKYMRRPTVAPHLAVASGPAHTIVVAGYHMLRSQDGGGTLELSGPSCGELKSALGRPCLSPEDTQTTYTTIAAAPGGRMYAGTSKGAVLQSGDSGASWSLLLSPDLSRGGITSLQLVGNLPSHAFLLVVSKSRVAKLSMRQREEVVLASSQSTAGGLELSSRPGFWGEPLARASHDAQTLVCATGHDAFASTSADGTFSNWTFSGWTAGLRSARNQTDSLRVPATMYLQSTPSGDFYAAGYSGVHRSVDRGTSWIKLDTLMPYITGILATRGASGMQVGVCTYAAGCFRAEVNTSSELQRFAIPDTIHDSKRHDAKSQATLSPSGEVQQRYPLLAYANDFATSGVVRCPTVPP